jgi:predicted glycogen debranching enzyme
VEIQALWYNALYIMEDLAGKFGDEAEQKRYRGMATVASSSFNRLFWNEKESCLYDVVNGGPPDPSIRPNQIFAVSLTHSMLPPERATKVVKKVQEHLLTPYGLHSPPPGDPAISRTLHWRPRARWHITRGRGHGSSDHLLPRT